MGSVKAQPSFLERPCLEPSFYARHTAEVARDLVGKVLGVRARGGRYAWARILETEAYRANDPASHCARGKTDRTAVMFEEPGHAYVYFIYGMYEMLNITTEPEGRPGAVLVRALEPLPGKTSSVPDLSGPGKLTRALKITRKDNREPFWGERFRIVEDALTPESVLITPRVGISAGREEPWRFIWKGHKGLSRARENRQVLGEWRA